MYAKKGIISGFLTYDQVIVRMAEISHKRWQLFKATLLAPKHPIHKDICLKENYLYEFKRTARKSIYTLLNYHSISISA